MILCRLDGITGIRTVNGRITGICTINGGITGICSVSDGGITGIRSVNLEILVDRRAYLILFFFKN